MSGTTKDQIIDELHRVLGLLHAPSYILATVDSRGDTLTDEEILEALQSWPSKKPEVAFVAPDVKWWGDEPVPGTPNTISVYGTANPTMGLLTDFGRPVVTLAHRGSPVKVDDRPGTFKAWSTFFEECNDGIGQFPVAIIEFGDGTVDWFPLGGFRFTDRGSNEKP